MKTQIALLSLLNQVPMSMDKSKCSIGTSAASIRWHRCVFHGAGQT